MTVQSRQGDLATLQVRAAQSNREPLPAIYLLWPRSWRSGLRSRTSHRAGRGPYWFVLGPLGGVVSWWLGWRAGTREGVRDADWAAVSVPLTLPRCSRFFLVIPPATSGRSHPISRRRMCCSSAGWSGRWRESTSSDDAPERRALAFIGFVVLTVSSLPTCGPPRASSLRRRF